ncbi:MAG: hypothetical protein ABIR28_15215 [Vicinamibacteria bacterium]
MRDDIQPDPPSNPVITRFVHHTWMLDLSPFHTLGDGGDLWLGGVFDAHSRTPLILKTYPKRPGAAAMAKLFNTVVAKFQKPKYVITDLGVEFKGAFSKAVTRSGAVLRRCVKENRYAPQDSNASGAHSNSSSDTDFLFPSDIHDLDKRLGMALTFYLQKPHKGLKGRSPVDVFRGAIDRVAEAIPAPRGSPGEGSSEPPHRVRFLDPQQHRFPILVPAR